MLKEIFKRIAISFVISAICGLLVNLIVDAAVNAAGMHAGDGFMSISPAFRELFPTPVMAAYINILLYGVIGAVFSGMSFVFDCQRIGYIVQSLIYFVSTAAVWIVITILLWQLHRYPKALIATIAGYGVTYIIMGIITYRNLKKDIKDINSALDTAQN